MKPTIKIGATAALASVVAFSHGYVSNREPRPRILSAPPELRVFDASGQPAPIALATTTRTHVLFLLDVGCAYCAETIPAWRRLVSLVQGADSDGPVVLVLSYSPPEQAVPFMATHGIADLPILYVAAGGVRDLNAWSMPTTAVITPPAKMELWGGVLSENDLNDIIAALDTE